MLTHLRRIIRRQLPKAQERVYPGWNVLAYRSGPVGQGSMLCVLYEFRGHAKIQFERGVLFDDPRGLLTPGKKSMASIQFASGQEINDRVVIGFLVQCRELATEADAARRAPRKASRRPTPRPA